MRDRTCIVTGANSGIGKEIANGLAARGARVVMVARDADRGEIARAEVEARTGNDRVELVLCDLSSQRQIRDLASMLLDRCEHINVLVNNAGLTLGEYHFTEDGIETTFAVNHLAPFLLSVLLLERLRESPPARIVTVASEAHRGSGDRFRRYFSDFADTHHGAHTDSPSWPTSSSLVNSPGASKVSCVTATCLHPGVVRTGFGREGSALIRLWFKLAGRLLLSPEKGADTAVWLASSPEVEGVNGGYFAKRRLKRPSAAARDSGTATRLWALSCQLTGLEEDRLSRR